MVADSLHTTGGPGVVGQLTLAGVTGNHGRGIEQILEAARQRLHRLDPASAHAAMRTGAILVDIRPVAQRVTEGMVPGALHVERNVLEWRFDPASAARLPVASYDLQVIIFCSEGYTSSLAAASLLDLGMRRATDLEGGFCAWQAAGLPVTRAASTAVTSATHISDS